VPHLQGSRLGVFSEPRQRAGRRRNLGQQLIGLNKGFAALALLASSAVDAAAEPATVESNVNLRSGPGGAFNVVTVIPEGSRLDVQLCRDEWCRVKFAHLSGYASRALLKIGQNVYPSVSQQPIPTPAESRPTLIGPYLWQWDDRERRDQVWRDIQFQNRMRPVQASPRE
jgi:uncharacterized protein YraI